MFSVPSIADELRKRERRSRPRRCCGVFDYTEFGPENGGILLDLSEGGLGFQGVAVVVEGQGIHLKFTLPGTSALIEADAEVARCNHLRTGGGLRFVNLRRGAPASQSLDLRREQDDRAVEHRPDRSRETPCLRGNRQA